MLVPGFQSTPERLYYAIEFSRITFPFIFFISLTALYSGILNSIDKFAVVASSPMAGNMVIIAIVMGFYNKFVSSGYAFAWGLWPAESCNGFGFGFLRLNKAWALGLFGHDLMKTLSVSLGF